MIQSERDENEERLKKKRKCHISSEWLSSHMMAAYFVSAMYQYWFTVFRNSLFVVDEFLLSYFKSWGSSWTVTGTAASPCGYLV